MSLKSIFKSRNDDIIVVNKSYNTIVHTNNSIRENTLINGLLYHENNSALGLRKLIKHKVEIKVKYSYET